MRMAGSNQGCAALQREAIERLLRCALMRHRQARGQGAGLVTGARWTSGSHSCHEVGSVVGNCAQSGREGRGRRCPRGGAGCFTCGARPDFRAGCSVHLSLTLAARYAGSGGTTRSSRTDAVHSDQSFPPCRVCGRDSRGRLGGPQRRFAHGRASPAVRGGRAVGATAITRASRRVGRTALQGPGRRCSRPTNVVDRTSPMGSHVRTSCTPSGPPTEPQGSASVLPRRCNTGHVTGRTAYRTNPEWTGTGARARRPNRGAKSEPAGAGLSAVPPVPQVIPVRRSGHEVPTASTQRRPLTAHNVVSGCVVQQHYT